ncbi:MAG TPA: carboxypeptidase regulatory-like domain-containing protein [Verrucomicrobiae bacterium]|nr:carboxypeptidase regulatory-like domain-containing protein [Verrucomicrobiae bacterium]
MNRRCFALAALVGTLQLVTAGDITGKITLKGTPLPEKDLPLDPNCGKIHPTKKTRLYVVGAGGELADTFVSIKDASGKQFALPEKPHLIDQHGCEYNPYVSGAMVNQKILVRNSDPVLHNVHTLPAVSGNKESNTAQLPKSKDLEYAFPKEESFLKFKCDVHPWMFAYVSVLNHPFFSVSGTDGTFKIANVPAGKYTVEAMHRKAGKQTMEVEVPATGSKEVNFTLDVK